MFHKGKRRRRFVAFAPAEASSFDSFSELERIATSFEPTLYQLDDHELESAADCDEPGDVRDILKDINSAAKSPSDSKRQPPSLAR